MFNRRKIDPRQLGLHHSTYLEQTAENRFVIVVNRKSRIIMKDGKAILQKIATILDMYPDALVDIETTAPVCSKTKAFLEDHNVSIQQK